MRLREGEEPEHVQGGQELQRKRLGNEQGQTPAKPAELAPELGGRATRPTVPSLPTRPPTVSLDRNLCTFPNPPPICGRTGPPSCPGTSGSPWIPLFSSCPTLNQVSKSSGSCSQRSHLLAPSTSLSARRQYRSPRNHAGWLLSSHPESHPCLARPATSLVLARGLRSQGPYLVLRILSCPGLLAMWLQLCPLCLRLGQTSCWL